MGTAWKNFGRMRTILLLPLLLALVECQQVRQQFDEFKVKFNKTYSSSNEEETRFEIFVSNLEELELTKTKASYSTGVTQFFDLTREEFRTFYLGGMKRPNPGVLPRADAKASKKSLPTSMDWREHGVVSAVKNQGQCGSCWAFATTEMVTSAWPEETSVALTRSLSMELDVSADLAAMFSMSVVSVECSSTSPIHWGQNLPKFSILLSQRDSFGTNVCSRVVQ